MMNVAAEVRVEKVEYAGWPNCFRISNDSVQLIVTMTVGLRVLHYGFIDGQNLFKEFPEQSGRSGEGTFQARGGHRLWKAPEDLATTWIAARRLCGPLDMKWRDPRRRAGKTPACAAAHCARCPANGPRNREAAGPRERRR
jgi:hypothetical protein